MTVASLMGGSVASVMTVVAMAVAMSMAMAVSSLLMIASIEVVGVLK